MALFSLSLLRSRPERSISISAARTITHTMPTSSMMRYYSPNFCHSSELCMAIPGRSIFRALQCPSTLMTSGLSLSTPTRRAAGLAAGTFLCTRLLRQHPSPWASTSTTTERSRRLREQSRRWATEENSDMHSAHGTKPAPTLRASGLYRTGV